MSDFQELIQFIRTEVNRDLKRFPLPESPAYLYNPIRYTFGGTGKRFRPILVHLSGRAFHIDPDSLMKIALATELLHNFTLVHDDIMDNDDRRHGQEAIHKKWDESTAILTGDGLFAIAQILLNNLPDRANSICCFFNEATLEVCEGQALDKEFENDITISVEQYLGMIEKKTGSLLGACAALPAILIGAEKDTIEAMDQFGRNLGQGFQIHDDLLEIYGNTEDMGKSLGSDISTGKQTLMVIMARENNSSEWSEILNRDGVKNRSLDAVRNYFTKSGIEKDARKMAKDYFDTARSNLEKIEKIDRSELISFIELVEQRST
ncbi:MAG: polyprenyl synthetase family protein [Candidatus Marinimicrobia bacterium]|nr:polyprenyl synthetase family protein [Candidatus Neomarinimicrobiota bacterium]MDP6820887.1 polyprenyl synthetase family protein [Candidatus Neomarinimicrobiota bacterium]